MSEGVPGNICLTFLSLVVFNALIHERLKHLGPPRSWFRDGATVLAGYNVTSQNSCSFVIKSMKKEGHNSV